MHEIDFYLAVNSEGEYDVGTSNEDATERILDNCGSGDGLKLYHITIKLQPPVIAELSATVPDDGSGQISLVVA